MVMQWPAERDMHDSASMKSSTLISPLLTRADLAPAIVAVQHGAAGNDDGRQVDARRSHDQRRCRLVAAAKQHHRIDRITPDRFLHVHGCEVAQEHRGRAQVRFAERGDRELEREAAGLEDAAAHMLGDGAEMRVARRQLGPGVADPDDRPAVEHARRHALVAHPAAVDEAVLVVLPVPFSRPKAAPILAHCVPSFLCRQEECRYSLPVGRPDRCRRRQRGCRPVATTIIV